MSTELQLYLIWILAGISILAGLMVLASMIKRRFQRAGQMKKLRRYENLQDI